MLIIGIDATNIRRGGGRTHLIEFLNAADPIRDNFSEVCVWGSKETLQKLPNHHWLKKKWSPALDGNLIRRTLWQKFSLGRAAKKMNCNVLFVPGGSFNTDFRPVISMSQNILPFEWRELRRYGFSLLTLKLILLRLRQSRSFRAADGVVFLTDYARQGVINVTGKLSGATEIIPHGLNPRFLISDYDLTLRKLSKNNAPINLIYVSIIDHYKHQWHVVEGVSMARRLSGLDLRLDLVGPSYAPALKRLKFAISNFDPNNEWINYRGTVDYDELHSLYAKAHIGVFASSCENMPNILLEMMGAGLPLLSSDRGPMPDILDNAGLYFDPETPESLAEVLTELLSSDKMMQHFSCAAYKKARDFSWSRCAESTFKFIHQIAGNYSQKGNPPIYNRGDK